jgi:hypothetical protein
MFIVYVLFIVYVTLPPGISPIAVGINNNNKYNLLVKDRWKKAASAKRSM